MTFGLRNPQACGEEAKPRLRIGDVTRLPLAFWVCGCRRVLTLARFSEAFLVLRSQNVGLPIALVPVVMVVMNIAYALAAYPRGRSQTGSARSRRPFVASLFCLWRTSFWRSADRAADASRRRILGPAYGIHARIAGNARRRYRAGRSARPPPSASSSGRRLPCWRQRFGRRAVGLLWPGGDLSGRCGFTALALVGFMIVRVRAKPLRATRMRLARPRQRDAGVVTAESQNLIGIPRARVAYIEAGALDEPDGVAMRWHRGECAPDAVQPVLYPPAPDGLGLSMLEKNQTPLVSRRADFGERGWGSGIVHSAWGTTTGVGGAIGSGMRSPPA